MEADDLQTVLRISIAVLIGALVGLQREQAQSRLGGVRTFPLVALIGALAGFVPGPWAAAAGLLALGAILATAARGSRGGDGGVTTEMAMLATYLIAVYASRGSLAIAGVAGAAVAVLLQFKPELHGAVDKLGREDMRAIMRFAVVAMIILPILPDQSFGPSGTLNPRESWLMVVLVVGLSLAGYIAYKFAGKRGGMLTAGLLGGTISSTATAFGYSRLAARQPRTAAVSGGVVALACAVVFVRIIVEIGVVAPRVLLQGALPLSLAAAAAAVFAAAVFLRSQGDADGIEPKNPGGMLAAVGFGAGYALVGLLMALGHERFAGSEWLVAAVSGLTDVDAVTLSTARLARGGTLEADTAWRLALVAAASNTLFKAGLVTVVSRRALAVRLGLPLLGLCAVTAAIALWWPA
ncbi:MAG: MgtC/SapB family protein [Elusimicrobiota bacterium]|nr:MgtC/SapB family protein [Elusimicrobiota bacterium]